MYRQTGRKGESILERAYTVCMIIGFCIPLCSLVLGSVLEIFDGLFDGISSLFDGLELDFTLDIGDLDICIIPFSLQSICAGLLVFGTVGKVVYNGENLLFANVMAAVGGYVAAMVIQTLIRRLKRVDGSPQSKEQLQFSDAKVTNTIVAGGFGAISITKNDGTTLSYPAKAVDSTEMIRQETPVYIIRFDKNVAIVKKANVSEQYKELSLYD